MTWQAGASGNVRRALVLELTQLLDALLHDFANALAWQAAEAFVAALPTDDELINGTDQSIEPRGIFG